jgi:CrcB protein
VGGFLGAVLRYLVSGWAYRLAGNAWFPYGTLTVNIAGCLLIGFLSGMAEGRHLLSPDMRALLFIGFIGSFTTFSTFSYETLTLARGGEMWVGLLNIGLHLGLGLIGVWLGFSLAKLI